MSTPVVIKTAILIVLLIVANAWFGLVSNQVYRDYEAVFSFGQPLFDLVVTLLGAIALVAIVNGLVAALVRPWWANAIGFGIAALAMMLVWGFRIEIIALGLIYFALTLLYARALVGELNNRINFSVRPIREEQGTLLFALVLLIGASAALGYRDDAAARGFVLPPAYKQAMRDMILPGLQAEIESERNMTPAQKAAALKEAQDGIDGMIGGLESALRSFAPIIPVILALMLIWALEGVLGFLAWIPPLILSGVFWLLNLLNVTHIVTENKPVQYVSL